MQESGGNYLETIYLLQKEGKDVHSVDVAKALGFSKPSVSRAMGLLKDAEYIEVAKNGVITLTKSGQKKAKELSDKGDLIVKFRMLGTKEKKELLENLSEKSE